MSFVNLSVSVDADAIAMTPSAARILPSAGLRWHRVRGLLDRHGFLGVLALGAFLRLWRLDAVGFNSDEAVYAGQAASIAGQPAYLEYFPIFRAHPLLFQSLLSLIYRIQVDDLTGRLVVAAFGVATLVVTYALGKLLYRRHAGLVAMSLLAVMPYHVTVTRQVLLDGPMVFFAASALYLLARYCSGHGARWLVAAGALMGLALITKETAVVLFGGAYCFFMLNHAVKIRVRAVAVSIAVTVAVAASFPLALRLGGSARSGGNYLAWQLFRRANHPISFYLTTVPTAVGLLVVALVVVGLVLDRKQLRWREGLLVCWCVVPIVFFTVMPIKGFQYLLPLAPALAVLAARTLTEASVWSSLGRWTRQRGPALRQGLWAVTVVSLLVPAWATVQPSTDRAFLAGTGGLPGGREAGVWIDQNVPEGATMLTIGPSMANVIAFYGHRQAYGLSVSPNPLNRNPSYTAVDNADLQLRNGDIQYAVWDSFSAARSASFSSRLLGYVSKYRGVAVHTETVPVEGSDGVATSVPVITVYELRP